jgi:hypothetical protein
MKRKEEMICDGYIISKLFTLYINSGLIFPKSFLANNRSA